MSQHFKNVTLFLFIFTVQFLSATTLTIGSDTVDAGGTVEIDISLDNPDDVIGGFQFTLNDFPDQLAILDMVATERTEHLMVQFAPETNTVVAFDLNGIGIVEGTGPILIVTYESTGVYTNSINSLKLTPIFVLNELDDFTLALLNVSIIFKFQL